MPGLRGQIGIKTENGSDIARMKGGAEGRVKGERGGGNISGGSGTSFKFVLLFLWAQRRGQRGSAPVKGIMYEGPPSSYIASLLHRFRASHDAVGHSEDIITLIVADADYPTWHFVSW